MSDNEKETTFYADMLEVKDRSIELEPIFMSQADAVVGMLGGQARFKGIALHQHCDLPKVTEEGVQIESRCDYVVLDMNQVMWLKRVLAGVKVANKDGEIIDE